MQLLYLAHLFNTHWESNCKRFDMKLIDLKHKGCVSSFILMFGTCTFNFIFIHKKRGFSCRIFNLTFMWKLIGTVHIILTIIICAHLRNNFSHQWYGGNMINFLRLLMVPCEALLHKKISKQKLFKKPFKNRANLRVEKFVF